MFEVGKTLLIDSFGSVFSESFGLSKTHYFCEYRLTGRLLVLASLIFSLREEAGARDVIAAGNFVDPTSMSDSSTADEAVKENLKVSKIQEAVIRIAGNSQDGIQSIGGFLARLAGRSEQEVMTFMTIPSTISGGPSIFQVRLSSGEVLTSGDEADVLMAFYQHSYDNHIDFVKKAVSFCTIQRMWSRARI